MVRRKRVPPGVKVFRHAVAIDLWFTMLTANANDLPLMKWFHRPGSDEASVLIVRPSAYENWINSQSTDEVRSFLNLHQLIK